jgi:hypothetical protein
VLSDALDPQEGARIRSQAARLLVEAAARESDAGSVCLLAEGSAALLARLDQDARESLAKSLTGSVGRASAHTHSYHINLGVSSMASQLDRDDATELCTRVFRLQLERLLLRDGMLGMGLNGVDKILPFVALGKVKTLAHELVLLHLSGYIRLNDYELSDVLADRGFQQVQRRASFTAAAIAQAASGVFPTARVVADEPYQCLLTTQQLIELLKLSTCFGSVRRPILDHLGNRYGRHFVNHWAFVRFAEERNLGWDFTTPPKRPDPQESIKRMLDILDSPEAK